MFRMECTNMKTYGGHKVSRLRPPEIRLINGIPFEEFQSETEFKKVPKGWTYNTDLYTVTENIEKKKNQCSNERQICYMSIGSSVVI